MKARVRTACGDERRLLLQWRCCSSSMTHVGGVTQAHRRQEYLRRFDRRKQGSDCKRLQSVAVDDKRLWSSSICTQTHRFAFALPPFIPLSPSVAGECSCASCCCRCCCCMTCSLQAPAPAELAQLNDSLPACVILQCVCSVPLSCDTTCFCNSSHRGTTATTARHGLLL